MKTIQMVVKTKDSALFITDFDQETNELTFRSSRNPEYKQTEKIVIKDDMIYTNLHYFHVKYLQKFIKENQS